MCAFDEGLYYNPGPMRIPHHHTTTLEYCRELGVPVEVFVNDNEAAYLYQTKSQALAGRRVRGREVRSDLGGYTAELLAKALPDVALDDPLTADEQEAFLAYLSRAGALDTTGKYAGTTNRGYDTPPGIDSGTPSSALPLDELLGSATGLYLQPGYLTQAPMFQVVGGMDRLAVGFAARLNGCITYGADVCEIRQREGAVDVTYTMDGAAHSLSGDYCICALPMHVLARMAVADIDPDLKRQFGEVAYAKTGKIGLQFRRRFWEEDDQIFGGISRTDQDITQIVYPSYTYLAPKGVLIGYYQTGDRAEAVGALTPAQRQALALEQGRAIHPQYVDDFENAFSVSWQDVRHSEGGWAQMSSDVRKTLSPRLLEPDRRVYFAGDHCSYVTAWMFGALTSGRHVAGVLNTREQAEAREAVA